MEPTRPTATERTKLDSALTALMPVLLMVAVMWVTEILDVPLDGRLDRFGIRPRRLDGLDGIVLSPFLHAGFGHLIANTVPFAVLGAGICLGSRRQFLQVTVIVGLIGGAGTWLTGGSNTIHIGASGLVFGYVLYLVSRGVFAKKLTYLFGGVVVLVVYGGVLWGLLPSPGVSWQGHLFGAIGGVAAASLLHGDHGDDDPIGGPGDGRRGDRSLAP